MNKKLFSFTKITAYRIVKKAFPDLYPNYFRMNRIAKMGGYTGASKQLGISSYQSKYSEDWNKIKRICKSVFGNVCPITGKSDKLHVHHIDFDPMNNEPENLIPLWTPYHKLIHARAGFSKSYETNDRAILLSVSKRKRKG